ncbi:MAG: redoxin domain-containing protein [Acidobacteria bacterium]|jgi:peroxiredoxin (alkyl hydroperoxide reductase subunit C)|nr:redoxin domain-containing protein [Acidobacteriota bacterium]
MKAYQADIAKFTDADTQIFGVSVDSVPALKHWSEELAPETKGLGFPLLSDFKERKVVKDYGIFSEASGFGRRATFVVDKEGIIRHIEEGNTAIDPSAAFQACNMLKKK